MTLTPPRTVILIPTYDEAGNLEPMLAAVHRYVPHAHILVIDDNSPDGTGQIADRAAARDEKTRIHVAHRPGKQGLGVAYRHGYRWAVDRGYERILQMDCDFSHDPADLPRMLALLDAHQVVVGSRRVPGGGTENWSWHRNMISTCASFYARTVLSSPLHDLTAGFKGFRGEALAKLPIEQLRTDGFGFQIEVSSTLLALGVEIVEMPIVFRDRKVGKSKMSGRIIAEAMVKVWSIRSEVKRLGS